MDWDKEKIFKSIKGGLIVSCQALEGEPMHSSYIMSCFAVAAARGGAVGIRANTAEDIKAIKKSVPLPVIGLVKHTYPDSSVYITPTIKEIDEVAQSGAEIVALDATARQRPGGVTLKSIIEMSRNKYKDILLMADCATFEEAAEAESLGFDFIGTTLRGYTEQTHNCCLPDIKYIKKLVRCLKTPIIAEGGILYPEQLKKIMETGVFCAVVGGAITRPQSITERFVRALM